MNSTKLLLLAVLLLGAQASFRIISSEFDNDDNLNTEALSDWTLHGYTGDSPITTCANVKYVGGYNIFGQNGALTRTYQLPTHFRVRVSFTALFVDSWDNEKLQLFVDDENKWEMARSWNQGTNLCGWEGQERFTELIKNVDVTFVHTSPTANVRITSTLNQAASDESWGIRDFQISIEACEAPNCVQVVDEFTGDFGESDVQGWTSNKGHGENAKAWTSQCGDYKLMGGFNSFAQGTLIHKTWTGLPSHYKAIISFTQFFIDTWDSEAFRVRVDGIGSFTATKVSGPWNGNAGDLCGWDRASESVQKFAFEVGHYGDSLQLQFQDALNQAGTDESWGFRDLRVYVIRCEENCQEVSHEMMEDTFESVEGWTYIDNGHDANRVSQCAGKSLLGGYNVFSTHDVQKTYNNLPRHTHVFVSFKLYAIDTWDNEKFLTAVDGIVGNSVTKSPTFPSEQAPMCGIGTPDQIIPITFEMPHTEDSFTLQYVSGLDQAAGDESWGVRELVILAKSVEGYRKISEDFVDTHFNDQQGWVVVRSPHERKISECGGKSLFGGFDTFGQGTIVKKTFTDLPPHQFVHLQMVVYFIDTWDNEAFTITIDGKYHKSLTKGSTWGGQQNLCGWDRAQEEVMIVEMDVTHSEDSVTIQIQDALNQATTDESWGMRDVHLYINGDDISEPECPTIYTECYFGGQSLNLCGSNPDFGEDDWAHRIRSIYVPEGWKVHLYQDTYYNGETSVLKRSVRCLPEREEFIQLSKAVQTFKKAKHSSGLKINKRN